MGEGFVLDGLLQRLGINPGDIAGTSVAGEIPFSESFVNRQVARALERNAHVASAVVTLRDGDEAMVRVEPRLRILPVIPLAIRIEQQPDLPRDPTLRLGWTIPASGPLALVAGKIAGYLTAMPPWIRLNGQVIDIDVRALLRTRGLEDVLSIVRRAAVHTRAGALVVQIEAALDR